MQLRSANIGILGTYVILMFCFSSYLIIQTHHTANATSQLPLQYNAKLYQNLPMVLPPEVDNRHHYGSSHIHAGNDSTSITGMTSPASFDDTVISSLQTSSNGDTWTSWAPLGGTLRESNIPIVIANTDGRLQVFVIGTNNALYYKTQTSTGSSTWSGWTSLGGVIKENTSPAVARNNDGRLQVFVVGSGGSLFYKMQTSPGSSSWTPWQSLGGVLRENTDPVVMANSDGTLQVFVVGTNNALYYKTQTSAGSSTWSGWTSLGGNIKVGSEIAVTKDPSGRLAVIIVDSNNAVYYKRQIAAGSDTGSNLYDDFETGGIYSLTDGQSSPNGKWKSLYTGFGTTRINTDQVGNEYIYLEPMTPTSPQETHGSAVATTSTYKDFDLTLDAITFRQLRQNSPPNNWETAWLDWNAIDQFHAYGFTLKIQGFQLEKKDNTNRDDSAEIYLVTQNSPSVKLNTWQKWHITVTGTETGTPRIQIWIDGTQIVDYRDDQPGIPRNSDIMKEGGPIVLYTEDAAVGFDNIHIKPL